MTVPSAPPGRFLNSGFWTGLLVSATGGFFLWRTLVEVPIGALHRPGPGAVPIFLAGGLIVSGIILAASALINRETPAEFEKGELLHVVLLLAGCAFAALGMDRIGYVLTVLITLLFFLAVVERKPIVTAVLVSFGLSFGSWYLLTKVMKQSLPSGPMGWF